MNGCLLNPDGPLAGNPLFAFIYNAAAHVLPCWLSLVIAGLVIMLILINAVLLGAAIVSWGERRLLGRFQNRVGPNRWGPFGAFQPIADLAKLITKEDIIPYGADRLAFTAVPVIMVAAVLLGTAVLPFAKDVALVDLNVGVLFVLAVSSLTSIAIFTAGWASNNRYALFGAGRAVAVLLSYEVPVVLSLLGVVMVAGSMSLGDIVAAQAVPFFLVQPLAFFVFIAGMSAELNRTPFDVAEAESEIIAGYHTEYSGIKFALIQAAEFGGVLVVSGLIATLFLAGWAGPVADWLGWLWFLIKVFIGIFLFVWIRSTYPRLRLDQIMAVCWKFLMPLSIINLAAVTLEVFFLRDATGSLSTLDLWIMAGINIVLAGGSILFFGRFIREKVRSDAPAASSTSQVVPGVPTIGMR
ncbi:MAG: NADH-quinone oxidoreductase subunit NuoH [Chloroflexota bacterium]|nr:NADH-quinone oxidoreductase subunit NuoH [Chloroflexota bacterium]MDE2961696.1 NADH-quinone oxidoreductase subunit NuoH [Chloroflexota bacterium]